MLKNISIEQLPESIQYLAQVVGLSATEDIVRERGGIRLCVPKKATHDHWLTKLIGIDKMRKLVSVYRGEEIDIPRCIVAIRAVRENEIANSDESNAKLARRYGYTERGIRKLKRRIEKGFDANQQDNDTQPDLFSN